MSLPVVAIVGRPNVGKSTLFNCFAREQKAIISDVPGTTRDRLMERVNGENFSYWLVDTAGLTNGFGDDLEREVQLQAELAIKNADVVLFLVDGKAEMTADDEEIVRKLRRSHAPVIFIANKIDDGNEARILELTRFGFGAPLAISAKNFTGMWEVEDRIEEILRKAGFKNRNQDSSTMADESNSDLIKLAFVGHPNVGKSSVANALLREERSVVSSVPHTTRDTIDTEFTDSDGQKFLFLDTAGLRRPGKLGRDLDFWSSVRTTKAIERSDVCALVLDALEGVTHQDAVIAGKIIEAGKGLILVVNKFDLAREKARTNDESDDRELDAVKMWGEKVEAIQKNYWFYLSQKLPFVSWAPVLFCSAKTGKNLDEILKSAIEIYKERKKRIATSELNRMLLEIVHGHVPPSKGMKQGKMKFIEQVETCPPKFLFFVNNGEAFHFSYRRYVERKLRDKYGFFGTPIILEFRDAMEKHRARKEK